MTTQRRKSHIDPKVLLQNDDYLNIQQAIEWINTEYKLDVTRQTVYRWMRVGLKGARWRGKRKCKLHTTRICGQLVTKKQWIYTFVAEVSLC